ncbi:MAG: chromate transporter [Clostridia bacterium]|nr:chromate transporter [Clostridia bacterium]
MILLDLFWTFARIGAFTFGGGYAMIPLIERETADRKGWISHADLLDIIAIAESTPGPIAINAATFIGRRTAGTAGAVCATLGVVLPSFLIILGLSYILETFRHIRAVQYAFWGIRAGVLALILRALVSMFKKAPRHPFAWAVMGGVFLTVAFLKLDAVWVIAASAALGLLSGLWRRGAQ